MGLENLEPKGNGSESYKIISHLGSNLPKEYTGLIRAPFLNSLRYGNDLFKLIDQDAFYSSYGNYINLLLERHKASIRMAILDDSTVLGWSMHEPDILHYVWVKKEVRRQGIGKALLPKEFSIITHVTNKGLVFWHNHFPKARFNPFA